MAQQQKNLAMDFAVLMLALCEKDFLPNLTDCFPDMSDIPNYDQSNWAPEFRRRLEELHQKIIESHQFGQYFIGKGYSWKEIREFVIKLQAAAAHDALQLLLEDPE